jgi:hypothetical protein
MSVPQPTPTLKGNMRADPGGGMALPKTGVGPGAGSVTCGARAPDASVNCAVMPVMITLDQSVVVTLSPKRTLNGATEGQIEPPTGRHEARVGNATRRGEKHYTKKKRSPRVEWHGEPPSRSTQDRGHTSRERLRKPAPDPPPARHRRLAYLCA